MGLAVRRRLHVADLVSLANAVVGFGACAVAFSDPGLAARLILVATVVDAVDGIVARRLGHSEAGPLLDSIADVVSFGVAPGLLTFGAVVASVGPVTTLPRPELAAVVVLVPAVFAAFSVLRTALYETYVDTKTERPGVPNALAAIILATAFLGGFTDPLVLLGATLVLAPTMILPFRYPKLVVRDAVGLGLAETGAILAPDVFGHLFPRFVLAISVLYALVGPWLYWGEREH